MPCFAANANIARTLAVGAKPDPLTVRQPAINDSGEKFRGSMLMVKGKTFAPGAKMGKYLKQKSQRKKLDS
jgi:hypothetical protein